MAFLKAFSKSLKKKATTTKPECKRVDSEMAGCDEETKPPASVESLGDEIAISGPEDDKIQLQQKLKEIGVHAAEDLLEEYLDGGKHWTTWYNSKGMKVEKTNECLSKSISGRGVFTWKPVVPIDMSFISSFLWDDKTKPQYDPATEAMVPLMDIDDNAHVVDQVFRSRFGFSGRDFLVVVNRSFFEDEQWERIVYGARSVDEEDVEKILSYLPEENEHKMAYLKSQPKLVRGFAHLAGLVISRNKSTGEYSVAYINDADAKTVGVPKWVIDRVKIDQLKIVATIPKLIEKAWFEGGSVPVAGDPRKDPESSSPEVHSAVEDEDQLSS